MSNRRELISLQFGHYSNHVGAHFWNIQELSFDYTGEKEFDVNHGVLYREGSLRGKVTYTPRLLLSDLKGALGSLSGSGGLESCPEPSPTDLDWPGVEKKEEPRREKNLYLKYINNEPLDSDADIENFDFESNVDTWTDYLFPRFHQRTVSVVNDYTHSDDKVQFDVFNMGTQVWKTEEYSETYADNVRKFSEECDNFQGFQMLMDCADGFGGLASGCLQYLSDEYHNKSIFCLPSIPAYFRDNEPGDQTQRDISNMNDSIRLVNMILTYESMFENSSLFVPICCGESGWRKPGRKREFYNVNYNHKLMYHTSAVIASALDTFSFPYRHKAAGLALSDLCADLTGFGRKMAAASLGIPFHMRENIDLIDVLDKDDLSLYNCITPGCKISNEKVFQHVVVRGIPESRFKQPMRSADRQIKMAAYRCNTVKEMFEFYFQCNNYASPTCVTSSRHGLEIKMPYPKIFGEDLNAEGFVREFESDVAADVRSVPVIAGLHNGNFLFDTLENLLREVKRVKIKKLHKFAEQGLESDEFNECIHKIEEIQNNYQDDFEL